MQNWIQGWIDKVFSVLIPLATLFGWQRFADLQELQKETLVVGHAIIAAVMAGEVIYKMIRAAIEKAHQTG